MSRVKSGAAMAGVRQKAATKNNRIPKLYIFCGEIWHDSRRMLKVTWAQAADWRMQRHHLAQREPRTRILKVASRLCGLHAQVLSSAELTLWARVEGLKPGDLQRALWEKRTLVKTWAMRGTLHLLPSSELSMWHTALGASGRYRQGLPQQKYFGITLEEHDQLTDAIARALEGRLMTREELVAEVARLTGSVVFGNKIAESSWGTILKPAAFTGRLCFGPSVGQRVQFTHPDTWLAGSGRTRDSSIDAHAATAEVTRRYLAAYGPATYRDLARWWGGAMATIRQWIAALGDEVVGFEVEGAKAWMLAAHARELAGHQPERTVRLLPGFDQYVVAASCHAEHLMPKGLRARVYRAQGWISPVLLVNGRMDGTWRHEVKGSRVHVTIDPFVKPLAWVRRAAEEEAERLATFLGCALNCAFRSPV